MTTPDGPRVLVVDDERDACSNMSDILTDLGYRVDCANDGASALELVRQRPYDVALLDLRMPGMSGFEVARVLKRHPATREIPILAITALDDEDDRREATDAGCMGCVTKPFTEESLAAAVTTVLASSASEPTR